ncbi:NAD(P)H-dependent oxidoreductase [Patescibacteria group bacterium]|nr:NAD(P)H-dependent oxidoreductase [Patescibacteria group bacterium]MBP9710081.1 NAD(P)H-dependent oxidoreductase [Patescibacteria group bacterium]
MIQEILNALNWRYATQVFDTEKRVSPEEMRAILEAARLAPSSFGIEPWKFLVIENPEVRAKLREVGFGQPKITDASHLVVVARRTDVREHITQELIERCAKQQGVDPSKLDGLKNMVEGSLAARSDAEVDTWVRSQTYIPLGIMIETAALLGIDAGPMEGFMPAGVDEVLGLKEKNLTATSMIAFGYRGEDSAAKRPKVRRPFEEVVEFVK